MNQLQQLERKSRLWHIEGAARAIQEFAGNRSLEEYERDDLLVAAVERQLIIIGEALNRASQVDPELVSQISDAAGIIGLRHQLVHNYPHIDTAEIFKIVTDDLPVLLTEVRALLNE
ncbi:MAG TPA: HepT-like ribonuclease domain-containing protein [Thermoanaerobaculia bacterium]|jgi:uncharacterized protein with HEPN domain